MARDGAEEKLFSWFKSFADPTSNKVQMKYRKVGVLRIWKAKSNVSSVGPTSERKHARSLTEGQRSKRWSLLSISAVHQPFYISILYLNTAYAAHYVYFINKVNISLLTNLQYQ